MYLLPVVLLAGLGVLSASRTEAEYKSIGVLNVVDDTLLSDLSAVRGNAAYSYETVAVRTTRNINELLRTDVFVTIVAEEAGLSDAVAAGRLTLEDVRKKVYAASAGDTLVQVISTAPVAQAAYQLSLATIDSYRNWIVQAQVSESTTTEKVFSERLNAYLKQVSVAEKDLSDWLAKHPAQPGVDTRPLEEQIAIQRLNDAVTQAETQYTDTKAKADDAKLVKEQAKTEAELKLRVVDEPIIPSAPESATSKSIVTVAIFTFLGLLIGASLLVLTTLLDKRVRSSDDIALIGGLEVVAVIPLIKRGLNLDSIESRRARDVASVAV